MCHALDTPLVTWTCNVAVLFVSAFTMVSRALHSVEAWGHGGWCTVFTDVCLWRRQVAFMFLPIHYFQHKEPTYGVDAPRGPGQERKEAQSNLATTLQLPVHRNDSASGKGGSDTCDE